MTRHFVLAADRCRLSKVVAAAAAVVAAAADVAAAAVVAVDIAVVAGCCFPSAVSPAQVVSSASALQPTQHARL